MARFGRTDKERVAYYLQEAQDLHQLARLLSLNRDRDAVVAVAVEYEQLAASLQGA